MIMQILKLFKPKKVNNERGSILAIALIIITVLTFSVSTITAMSINLASSTTAEMQNLNEESEAKAKIRLAIIQFEEWTAANGFNFDSYTALYENNPTATYGVTVTEVTDTIEGLNNQTTVYARAYRFAVTLTDGRDVVMYDYVSSVGVETTAFAPFEYSIGTSGDLIFNSGVYSSDAGWGGTTTPLKAFGNNILLSRLAPFIENGSTDQNLTSFSISRDPVLTTETAAELHYNSSIQYCGGSNCYTTNATNDPFIIEKDNFADFTGSIPSDQGTTGSVVIQDFFGDFDYNDYIIDFIENDAPTLSRTINATWDTLDNDIYDNSSELEVEARYHPRWGYLMGYRYTWPTDDFVDITANVDAVDFSSDLFQQRKSFVYFGNDTNPSYDVPTAVAAPLVINDDLLIRTSESLIVFGDLYLNSSNTQDIHGEVVVTGNLYITGGNKDWEGSIMVFGETFIELDDYRQFYTHGFNSGITFMCKDNIHFISHDESHSSSAQSDRFYMFIYTDESIIIDAVNSRINMSGVIYARALGVSGNNIFMEDGTDPIRGIVVNSFYGYVNNSGNFVDGNGDDSYRFEINVMSSSWYADRFENLPTFNSVVVSTSEDPEFLTTEFMIE
ncbi:hypothetical protein KQ51_01101 [Candidatus Izimaplasma bacterium HR1]|jgi:hypothetical protein|uniref:hypothetical protein n=1 Tax=Candidatus Izimoplasma sp. HR1 TaxID=1541959 RepID=UPI0004F68F7D|nr:hypothetical protein KQ51_01101 [Candidatus Izimaplasma bacterium HR1]